MPPSGRLSVGQSHEIDGERPRSHMDNMNVYLHEVDRVYSIEDHRSRQTSKRISTLSNIKPLAINPSQCQRLGLGIFSKRIRLIIISRVLSNTPQLYLELIKIYIVLVGKMERPMSQSHAISRRGGVCSCGFDVPRLGLLSGSDPMKASRWRSQVGRQRFTST